jgi:hypothetical protein
MLPGVSLPISLRRLVDAFVGCFTAPTLQVFHAMVLGLLAQTGNRTVCGMLTGARPATSCSHHRAHRFFSTARWSVDQLGLTVFDLVLAHLVADDTDLHLAVDDTAHRRRGRKVHGAGASRSGINQTQPSGQSIQFTPGGNSDDRTYRSGSTRPGPAPRPARVGASRPLNAEDALKTAYQEIHGQRARLGEFLRRIRDLELDLPEDAVQRLVTDNTTLKQQIRALTTEVGNLTERLTSARSARPATHSSPSQARLSHATALLGHIFRLLASTARGGL